MKICRRSSAGNDELTAAKVGVSVGSIAVLLWVKHGARWRDLSQAITARRPDHSTPRHPIPYRTDPCPLASILFGRSVQGAIDVVRRLPGISWTAALRDARWPYADADGPGRAIIKVFAAAKASNLVR